MLLEAAARHPLALLELPAALAGHPAAADRTGPLPAVLPLSRRLQSTFADALRHMTVRHAIVSGAGRESAA